MGLLSILKPSVCWQSDKTDLNSFLNTILVPNDNATGIFISNYNNVVEMSPVDRFILLNKYVVSCTYFEMAIKKLPDDSLVNFLKLFVGPIDKLEFSSGPNCLQCALGFKKLNTFLYLLKYNIPRTFIGEKHLLFHTIDSVVRNELDSNSIELVLGKDTERRNCPYYPSYYEDDVRFTPYTYYIKRMQKIYSTRSYFHRGKPITVYAYAELRDSYNYFDKPISHEFRFTNVVISMTRELDNNVIRILKR